MKISARNVFQGRVVRISHGTVNTEIELETRGGTRIVSMISRESAKNLKLKKGKKAYAVIKASSVMIALD